MYRYKNVRYNGFLLSSICDIEEIRLPVLPSRSISTLDISSRDGEIYNGKKYESYIIEIDILIDCDTQEECRERLKNLREIFDVDEPKPFFINENKFILAITKDKIEKEPVAFHSYTSTIKLFCPEPYFYSKEIKVADSVNKKVTVTNSGNRPTLPIIAVGFSSDAYFAQLELKETGERILVGKYPKLNLSQVSRSTSVLYDNCETATKWTNSVASIDSDRTTGGTLANTSDNAGLMIGTIPSGNTTWKGVCVRQNLEHSVDEFKLSCTMIHNSTGQNGDPSRPKYKNDEQVITSGGTTKYYVVTASALNVRTGPSTSYKKLGTLPNGHRIDNGTFVNGWLKFNYNGKDGYCSGKYLDTRIQDNTVTTIECNFVAVNPGDPDNYVIYIREAPSKSSKLVGSVHAGVCVRCEIKDYVDSVNGVTYYKMTKPTSQYGYMGYIAKANLVKAESATIEYSEKDAIETADDKTGIIELYGFDTNGVQLFCLGMYDDNEWYEYTYPKCRVGSRVVLQDPTTVPKPKVGTESTKDDKGNATVKVTNKLSGTLGNWNDFYGNWTLSREKINGQYVWNVQVQKIVNGVTTKIQKTNNIKYTDLPTNKLSYVVLYIGTSGDMAKASGMALNHVQIDEINPKEDTKNKNVFYFRKGDILEIDCENHRCFLNDESCDDLVDIGSRYFQLQTGENNIKMNSNDDGIVAGVIYREKWLGD